MKETIFKVLALLIFSAALGFACYNAGKSSVYSAQFEYQEKTEALLDSIYSWDNSFIDTVMETDVYYEYELAKEAIQ